MSPKLAKLTDAERKEYNAQIDVYKTCCGYTQPKAEQLAWTDLLAQFPRLLSFDGAKNE